MPSVGIIGAGLAGSEAALVLARHQVNVTLYEMRPERSTPAHTTGLPAELVCSNSLKSMELPGAQALLKAELELLSSPLLACAKRTSVPAGKALAVDRKAFSEAVLAELRRHPALALKTEEVSRPPRNHDFVIIAAGPLSSDAIVGWLKTAFSAEALYFYDAIAPIVSADSINLSKAFSGSRWRPEEKDYINCPFTEEEYVVFRKALLSGETAQRHSFEREQFFEACLPLDIIASRGYESMAYGPLKPIGFTDPQTGKRPFALCQLRREDAEGTSYSLVACQTRLTQAEQTRIFRKIPGLEQAEFLRFGSCHRNTFMNSPELLSKDLSFRKMTSVLLAGQLCGNEGYVESIATGHLAALFILAKLSGKELQCPPDTSALGSLLGYVTTSQHRPFSPTSFHFGLLPPLPALFRRVPKKEKQTLLCNRALEDILKWIGDMGHET